MNPVLLKPTSDRASQVVVMGRATGVQTAAEYHDVEAGAAARGAGRPRRPAGALRRRDLRGGRQPGRDQPARRRHRQPAAGPRRRACRRSSSATSTGAGCSPRSTARWPCCPTTCGRTCGGSSSTSSGATRRCWATPAPTSSAGAACPRWAWCRWRRPPTSPTSTTRTRSPSTGRTPGRPARRNPRPSPTCSTSPHCAGPGWPTPATSTRCASSRGCGCGGCGPWPSWDGPTSWSCPDRRTPGATSTGSTPPAWPPRSSAATPRWWRCAPGCRWSAAASTTPTGVEGPPGGDKGLGWLPVTTDFRGDKVLDRPGGRRGRRSRRPGEPVAGYRIHHGRVRRRRRRRARGWSATTASRSGGGDGRVAGTTVHGLFEADGFRAGVLAWAAERAGKRWAPGGLDFAAARLARLDRVADLLEAHLDLDRAGRPDRRGRPVTAPADLRGGARAGSPSRRRTCAGGWCRRASRWPATSWRAPIWPATPKRSPPRSPPRPRGGAATTRRCWPRCGGRPTPTGWPARRWRAGCCRAWHPTCGRRRWRSASPAAARPRSCTSPRASTDSGRRATWRRSSTGCSPGTSTGWRQSLRARHALGRSLIWGNVAAACASAAGAVRAAAGAALARPPRGPSWPPPPTTWPPSVAGPSPPAPTRRYRRTTCCLWWKTSAAAGALCADCSLARSPIETSPT